MKQHDWILENINNQSFSSSDFKSIGLTTENTLLLPMDDYLKSSYIQDNPLFKGENNEFSKDKFLKFYNERASEFMKFSQDYDTFKYDLFDTSRKIDSETTNSLPKLVQVSNPSHTTTGIAGPREVRKSALSDREYAQISKIFNPETGEFEDYSINDHALFRNPVEWVKDFFKDPVVYATYDEDGVHIDPITHREAEHKKGQFKMNPEGEYYAEKLGNRNIRDKQVVSFLDNITVDTSGINKYDFFDADGLEKSAAGVVMSTAAAVAPLFAGPVVGGIYSGLLITRELSKSLPMLSGMIDSVFGTELEKSKFVNALAGKAQQFTQGTSLYSQEKMFTFENIGKLISDVANQWGQQQLIAKAVRSLAGGKQIIQEANNKALTDFVLQTANPKYRNTLGINNVDELTALIESGKWTETAVGKASLAKYMPQAEQSLAKLNRLGADASLAYMAIISNTDVYDSMLKHGATKGEAALFALGSTVGMFSVDRFLNLGEYFFDELGKGNVTRMMNKNLDEITQPWLQQVKLEVAKGKQNPVLSILNTAKNFGKKYANQFILNTKYHTGGFMTKAFGEGLEETTEELVTDLTKTLYEQLGNLGVTTVNDVGAWDNGLARYSMSFLGGALGGGIFYGAGVVNGQYPIQLNDEDVLFHIRNNKLNDYLKEIDKREANGEFGNMTLSATPTIIRNEATGKDETVYLTTNNEEDSQNHYIAQRARQALIQLDALINGNLVNLTDEQLFDQMVMSELRYLDMKDWLKDESYATNYYLAYQDLTLRMVKAEQDLLNAASTRTGTPDGEHVTDEWRRNHREDTPEGKLHSENLRKYQEQKDLVAKLLEDFLSGDTSLYYTRKLMFGLDGALASRFFPITFEQFVLQNHNVNAQSLNEVDREKYIEEYKLYQKDLRKATLSDSFDSFLKFEKVLSPFIQELEDGSKGFEKYEQLIGKVFDLDPNKKDSLVNLPLITPETQLENETPEDIIKYKEILGRINTATEEELAFVNERDSKVEQENARRIAELTDTITNAGNSIDPNTFRQLLNLIDLRRTGIQSNIRENHIKNLLFEGLTVDTIRAIQEKLRTFEDSNETIEEVLELLDEEVKKQSKRVNGWLDDLQKTLVDGLIEIYGTDEDLDNLPLNQIAENLKGEVDTNPELVEPLINLINDNIGEEEVYLDDFIKNNTKEVNIDTDSILTYVKSEMDYILDELKNNQYLQFLNGLYDKANKANPFIDFIKRVGGALGIDGIEDIVQEVFDASLNVKDISDFNITPEQLDKFGKVDAVLDSIQAYLQAASPIKSELTPYGHNKTVNDYVKNHSSKLETPVEPLPEISMETFNVYTNESAKYKNVIDYLIALYNINAVNKRKKFLTAHDNSIKSRQTLLDNIREFSKFTIDDKEIDLFDGVDNIDSNLSEATRLYLTEELIYNNVKKSGYTPRLIFEASKILDKLVTNEEGADLISTQHTSNLDENLNYDNFTNYDRFNYLLSLLSLDSRKWHTFLSDRTKAITDKVPLDALLFDARIALSAVLPENTVFEDAVNYLVDHKLIQNFTKLPNTVFIPGLGGTGKTSATAKYAIDYLIDVIGLKESDIWLSAPTKDLRKNLKSGIGRGIIKESDSSLLGKELISMAMDPNIYDNIIADLKAGKTDSEYYTVVGLPSINSIQLNWDKIKLNMDAAPKLLVVDEYTWFDNVAMQILNKWTKVMSAGDNTLSGNYENNLLYNIDREGVFAIRTPKLMISLRDNNLLNFLNQRGLALEIDYILDADEELPSYKSIEQEFLRRFQEKYPLRVYNNEKLNGTLVTPVLDDTIISKLSGDIAFVGSRSSENFAKLKEAGLKVTQFDNIRGVQGSEFDFLVSDLDIVAKDPTKAISAVNALKDTYTLVSRAKTGSVLLGDVPVYSTFDKFSATAPSIMDAFEEFKRLQLQELSDYLSHGLQLEKKTEEPEEKPEKLKEDVIVDDEEEETVELMPTPEETSDVVDLQLLLNDSIVYPVYTNINTRGARLVKKGRTKKILKSTSDTKRDIEIFMDNDIAEDDYDSRTTLEAALRQLMTGIIYDKPYHELSLGKDSNKYLSMETYDKLKLNIFLEVRQVDPERDVRMNPVYGRKGSSETIDLLKDNKTIALIAEADGLQVTLGYFGNPKSQLDPKTIKALSDRINRSASRLKAIRDQEVANKTIIKNDEKYRQYTEEYTKLLDKANENKLRNDAVRYETSVNNLIDKGPAKYKIELERNGLSNLYRIKGMPALLSDVRKNPNIKTSKVVIYNGGLPGVSDSLRGRAVVIQTGDVTANAESLPNGYVTLRLESTSVNPLDPTPKSRMMVLNTRGLHLNELLDKEITSPISWQIVGLKSFVSAWNFRADLLTLQKEFQKFLGNNNYSQELVGNILTLMDDEIRGVAIEKPSNYDEIKQKLIEFNKSLDNKVREFRLGGRKVMLGSESVGSQYIRKLNLDRSNPYYKHPEKALGIYIHPDRMDLFIRTLNAYFNAFKPLVDPQFNGNSLSPKQIISGKEKTSNNINGYITDMQRKNIYTIDGIELGSGSDMFASFLIGTLRVINQAQGIGTPDTSMRETFDRKAYLGVRLKVNDSELQLETSEIFKDIFISPTDADYTIKEMFELILHGTTEAINDNKGKLKVDVPKATAAYFKSGIWPEARKGTKGSAYFTESTLDESFFTLDAIAESPTFRITKDSLDKSKAVDTSEMEAAVEESLELIQQAQTLSSGLFNKTEEELLELLRNGDTYENILRNGIKSNIELIFNGTDINNLLNLYVGTDKGGNTITLMDKLKQSGVEKLEEILEGESNKTTRTLKSGSLEITIKKNRKTVKIDVRDNLMEPSGSSTEPSTEPSISEKLRKILLPLINEIDDSYREDILLIVDTALDALENPSLSDDDRKNSLISIINTLDDRDMSDVAGNLILKINDLVANNLHC